VIDLERLGGEAALSQLVERFYAGVEADRILRPLYPADMSESKRNLLLFLVQYWGGEPVYNRLRGHPRLRLRHQAFPIGPEERDAWLSHMRAALDGLELDPEARAAVEHYFDSAAHSLVNAPQGNQGEGSKV